MTAPVRDPADEYEEAAEFAAFLPHDYGTMLKFRRLLRADLRDEIEIDPSRFLERVRAYRYANAMKNQPEGV